MTDEPNPRTRSPFHAIGAIDYTVIFVRDMAAMRRFYEDVLAFPLLRELSPNWIEYGLGGNTLALARPSRTAADAPTPAGSASLQLAFKVSATEVDQCADELVRQGVALLSPPTNQSFGHRTLFFRARRQFAGGLCRDLRRPKSSIGNPRSIHVKVKLRPRFRLSLHGRGIVKRILKPVTYILAAIYFLVDAVFMAVARPMARWIGRHFEFKWLRTWIRSLSPYPSLALFSVPVIILEPIKPVAAYLAATGQVVSAAVTFIVGELLKLVLVERLFHLTRDKLMRIPAFAWAYGKFSEVKAWLQATDAWRAIRALSRAARDTVARVRARLVGRFSKLATSRD